MMSWLKVKQGACLFLLGAGYGVTCQAASFDCAKAVTAVEKRICANPELSKLDEKMSGTYKEAIDLAAEEEPIRREQRGWIKDRNRCEDDACLVTAYEKRLKGLSYYVSAPRKAWRIWSGESPGMARANHPPLPSVAPLAER
jgi:uncharacterized protein